MRRFALGMLVAVGAGIASVAPAGATTGTTICIQKHCYSTLRAAVDAAHDGDTIKLGPGRFAGGVTIAKSVDLVGAGAGATTISGGGPVLTIGVPDATSEPTVSIAKLTITGGVNHGVGPFADGGGIQIPAAAGFTLGATVSLRDVVVSGNRAEPTATSDSPSGVQCPNGEFCPFAAAFGGGIYNAGTLSVSKSVISDNVAAGIASDADGGGIWSALGSLSIKDSLVARNHAIAAIPNGRFAEGGGLFVESGSLTVKNTTVSGNSAELTSQLPVFAEADVLINMNANSGGIHVGDGAPTLIANSVISGNSVSAIDPVGEPFGFDAAMLVGSSPLTMRNTRITGNSVTETVATSEDQGPGGSVLELDGGGTITDTVIAGNDMSANSPTGDIAIAGALAVFTFDDNPQLVTVKNSVISGNTAAATGPAGAFVLGAGIFNNSLLELRNVQVSGNAGAATGLSGEAHGGGIWNGADAPGAPVELTLTNSSVTRNSLTGSAGVTVSGGGLFTPQPVTLTRSLIARNAPDQCSGC